MTNTHNAPDKHSAKENENNEHTNEHKADHKIKHSAEYIAKHEARKEHEQAVKKEHEETEHAAKHTAHTAKVVDHKIDEELPEGPTFKEIVTDKEILRAIEDLGFTHPTEIQSLTLKPALEGNDLIAQAKTGSGKTFAFGIPIMHNMTKEKAVQAIILAPTRELCQQITIELKKLAKYRHTKIVPVYGGVSINPQIDALETAQIVVGTPGRMLDHLERNTMQLDLVRTVVLDEADRMFDMGFIDDVERIMSACPTPRQTLLYSATMPDAIRRLVAKYQTNPVHIKAQSRVSDELLPQFYATVDHNRKFSLLMHFINAEKPTLGIVFCATRTIAEVVARNLQRQNVHAESLHGGHSQAKRDRVMQDFREGKIQILIATDVAARGLDVKNVTHVFNYDVPKNPEDYLHRIGRTARAGESGKAITLLESRDYEFFSAVLDLPNIMATEMRIEDFKNVGFARNEEQRSYGGGQRRDSGSRGGFGGREGPRSGGFGSRDSGRSSSGPRRESSGRSEGGRSEGREGRSERSSGSSRGGWSQSRRQR